MPPRAWAPAFRLSWSTSLGPPGPRRRAWIGNRAVPIHRANYLFRAVKVPRGASTVVFEYRPSSFRWGLALTLATALVIAWRLRAARASPTYSSEK